MTNHPAQQDPLLTDLLSDESYHRLRETSLARVLAQARRRRRHRHLTRGFLLLGLTAAALLGPAVLDHEKPAQLATPPPAPTAGVPPAPPPAARPPAPATASRVEFINDDQLLALFPNRPVALVGRPGAQRLIFLDADGGTTQ